LSGLVTPISNSLILDPDPIKIRSDILLYSTKTQLTRVLMDTGDKSAVVERSDLTTACEEGKLEREVVEEVPDNLWDRQFRCVKVLTSICTALLRGPPGYYALKTLLGPNYQ